MSRKHVFRTLALGGILMIVLHWGAVPLPMVGYAAPADYQVQTSEAFQPDSIAVRGFAANLPLSTDALDPDAERVLDN